MPTVTIVDPVTRVEGHLKIQITIDTLGGITQVTDAQCTGTLFRGFEIILNGRDPKDATFLTQRICGVCPVSHAVASTRGLESAAKFTPPTMPGFFETWCRGPISSSLIFFISIFWPRLIS